MQTNAQTGDMTAVIGTEHLTLGKRLAFARQLAGIEQKAFAPMLGVARPTLSAWERDVNVGRDLVGWSLVVYGKGGKVRVLPLPAALAMGLLARGQGFAFEGAVEGHLSARRVGEVAQGVLPAPWTIHKLRHRFATDMHNEYGNLEAVRKLLGHASVATTQRYIATDDGVLRAMMERRAL